MTAPETLTTTIDTVKGHEESAGVICEFLEVAFGSILYARELYPHTAFERMRKYNVPVQAAKQPQVRDYIQDLIRSIKPLLEKEKVEQIALVILDKKMEPIEKFTFELKTKASGAISQNNDAYLLRCEQSLRAFLLKLYTVHANLERLPKDCLWTVHVHTVDSTIIDMQQGEVVEGFKWVEADESQTKIKEAKLLPLKSMSSPVMEMQLYVEESPSKKGNNS